MLRVPPWPPLEAKPSMASRLGPNQTLRQRPVQVSLPAPPLEPQSEPAHKRQGRQG